MINRILFKYPAIGLTTDSLQLTQGLELDAPKITAENPVASSQTFGGNLYAYRKAVTRKVIPLKIDILNTSEKVSLINWFTSIAQGATNTFSYINQDGDSKEFEVRIMDDVLDFGEGTFPFSVSITLLVVNEIRRWTVDISLGLLWDISETIPAGDGTWAFYGNTPNWDGTPTFVFSDGMLPWAVGVKSGSVEEVTIGFNRISGADGHSRIWKWVEDAGWNAVWEAVDSGINGGGDFDVRGIGYFSTGSYNLYFGTYNSSTGHGRLIRMNSSGSHSLITNHDGGAQMAPMSILEYSGNLFLGEWGGKIWYSATGNSASFATGFDSGDAAHKVYALFSWGGNLYAAYGGSADSIGRVYRSNSGTGGWSQVLSYDGGTGGFVYDFVVFGGQIYAAMGSNNGGNGSKIYRSSTGANGDWNDTGFGNDDQVTHLEVHNGYIYAATAYTDGKIYRSNNGIDWSEVFAVDDGSTSWKRIRALKSWNGTLYASIDSSSDVVFTTKRGQMWSSTNGTSWSKNWDCWTNRVYNLTEAYGTIFCGVGRFNGIGKDPALVKLDPDTHWQQCYWRGDDRHGTVTNEYFYNGLYAQLSTQYWKDYRWFSQFRKLTYLNNWSWHNFYSGMSNQRDTLVVLPGQDKLVFHYSKSPNSYFYWIDTPGGAATRFDAVDVLGHGLYSDGGARGGGTIAEIPGNVGIDYGSAFVYRDSVDSKNYLFINNSDISDPNDWSAYEMLNYNSVRHDGWLYPVVNGNNTDEFFMVWGRTDDGNDYWLYSIDRTDGTMTILDEVCDVADQVIGMFWYSGKLWISVKTTAGNQIGWLNPVGNTIEWLDSDTPGLVGGSWDNWDHFFHDGSYFRLIGAYENGVFGDGANSWDIRRF